MFNEQTDSKVKILPRIQTVYRRSYAEQLYTNNNNRTDGRTDRGKTICAPTYSCGGIKINNYKTQSSTMILELDSCAV